MRNSSITIAVVALAAGHASAQISYFSQTRTLNTFGGVPIQNTTINAPTAAPFTDSLSNLYAISGTSFFHNGTATHSSTLDPDEIRFSGTTGGTAGFPLGGGAFAPAGGVTSINVTFDLSTTQPFRLFGSVFSALTYNSTSANIYLIELKLDGGPSIYRRDQNLVFSGPNIPNPDHDQGSFNATGTLQPGRYVFSAFVRTSTGFSGATGMSPGSIDVTLEIPAPAAGTLLAAGGVLALRRRRRTLAGE